MASEDMMFSSRTDDELMRLYHGMIETARRLGMQEIDEAKEFTSREHLLKAVEELHASVEKFRAGVDAKDEEQVVETSAEGSEPTAPPTKTTGLARLRRSKRAEEIRQNTLSDQAAARSAAAKKKAAKESKMSETTTAAPAKKATKKTAKKAATSKGAAKKTAAKAASKKAAAAKARGGNRTVDDSKRISVKVSENPRRKGTTRFDRFAEVMKADGKTVGEFVKKGGSRTALGNAVKEGHVALK